VEIRLASIAFGAGLAAAAAAAPEPASAGIGQGSEAVRLRTASRCVLHQHWEESRQAALALPGSREEAAAFAKVDATWRRCFAHQHLADTPEMRALFAGKVAERIYVSTVTWFRRSEKRVDIATSIPAAVTLALTRPRGDMPPEVRAVECAAAGAPNDVDRLLRSDPGSKTEAAAMAAVSAALAPCLDRGQALRMRPLRFRAEIARAFYRVMGGIRYQF
jgi:hypothetical protein